MSDSTDQRWMISSEVDLPPVSSVGLCVFEPLPSLPSAAFPNTRSSHCSLAPSFRPWSAFLADFLQSASRWPSLLWTKRARMSLKVRQTWPEMIRLFLLLQIVLRFFSISSESSKHSDDLLPSSSPDAFLLRESPSWFAASQPVEHHVWHELWRPKWATKGKRSLWLAFCWKKFCIYRRMLTSLRRFTSSSCSWRNSLAFSTNIRPLPWQADRSRPTSRSSFSRCRTAEWSSFAHLCRSEDWVTNQ